MASNKLFKAIETGSKHECLAALKDGIDIESLNGLNLTPLIYAIRKGNVDIIDVILRHGANLESRDPNGSTPLNIAARCGNTEICKELLRHGANIQSLDVHGNTPLHLAAYFKHLDVCMLLVDNGANLDVKNFHDHSALDMAVNQEFLNICLFFVANNASAKFTVHKNFGINNALQLSQLEAAAKFGNCSLLLKIMHEDNYPQTLQKRVVAAIDLALDANNVEAAALMQSWLARQSMEDLIKNKRKHGFCDIQ